MTKSIDTRGSSNNQSDTNLIFLFCHFCQDDEEDTNISLLYICNRNRILLNSTFRLPPNSSISIWSEEFLWSKTEIFSSTRERKRESFVFCVVVLLIIYISYPFKLVLFMEIFWNRNLPSSWLFYASKPFFIPLLLAFTFLVFR